MLNLGEVVVLFLVAPLCRTGKHDEKGCKETINHANTHWDS